MVLAAKLCKTEIMVKKKIGRPNEERRARQLLERIARKKAAPKKATNDLSKPALPNGQSPKQN